MRNRLKAPSKDSYDSRSDTSPTSPSFSVTFSSTTAPASSVSFPYDRALQWSTGALSPAEGAGGGSSGRSSSSNGFDHGGGGYVDDTEGSGREGVWGDTGYYAYSITADSPKKKKKTKGGSGSKHHERPGSLRFVKHALGRSSRDPPPSRLLPASQQLHLLHLPDQDSDFLGIASDRVRPASSIYSQPSPEAAVFAVQQLRNDPGHAIIDISPPSSPDARSFANGSHWAYEVSPIDDDTDDMAKVTTTCYATPRGGGSDIPAMRRERRKNNDAVKSALRTKASQERLHNQKSHDQPVRWDHRTGEPTSDDKGHMAQVNPQAYANDLAKRDQRAAKTSIFGSRIATRRPTAAKQEAAKPEPESLQSARPAWQGGSGRMAIADPLQDSKNAPPLVKPVQNDPSANSPSHYPSPPDSHAPAVKSPPAPAHFQFPAKAPDARDDTLRIPSNDKAFKRKPAASHKAKSSWSSSIYSAPSLPQTPVAPAPPALTRNQSSWDRPGSSSAGQSILDRKRPVTAVPRSPPTGNVIKIDMSSPYRKESGANKQKLPSRKQSSPELKSLPLPPAPPEENAKDGVDRLNAMLEQLGNRRINLNTAIKQITELMPQDRILSSEAVLLKREAEKRKVEALKLELAEVDREVYDIGLKLHRAYKRLDRNDEFESTGLWIKRATDRD